MPQSSYWCYVWLTLRVRSSTLVSTFFFFLSQRLYHCLWAPFSVNNSKYVAALLFFKACTKGYVVISCLTPLLNTDMVKQ